MLRLLTFGGLALVDDAGSAAPATRPPRLALLAALAAAGERGMSRERLIGFFWPDSDETRGRHSLRQALYSLRQELGRDVVSAHGAALTLNTTEITTDIAAFREALASSDRARAVAVVRGPFLDGFYLAGVPEFERWVEEERARLVGLVTEVLVALATEASAHADHDAAVEWWRRLAALDPLSGRFAVGYLESLAARGDRAEALAFARAHTAVVRRELETDPDPAVRRIEARLRAHGGPVRLDTPANEQSDVRSPLPPGEPAVVADPAAPDSPPDAAPMMVPSSGFARRVSARMTAAATFLVLGATAAVAHERGWLRRGDGAPMYAVGLVRDDGTPDSLRMGRVLTDMLATNLGRVGGLSVLANSRLLELMPPGRDSSAVGYVDAARRAGASELLEGRVLATPPLGFTLELRHVELGTGVVKRVYRVTARDRFALVDSMTRRVADRLQLVSPDGSVADATTTSLVAYRLYTEGLRAYSRLDHRAAMQLMRAALAEDSSFAMAAYYEAKLALETGDMVRDSRPAVELRPRALRLAMAAPQRERLTITADLLQQDHDPRAVAVAESLAALFPHDPRGLASVARVQLMAGEWAGAASALEQAIAIDSAAGRLPNAPCRVCDDLVQLHEVYLWWDSLPAAERTARRLARFDPATGRSLYALATAAARRGDSALAYASYRRMTALDGANRTFALRLDLTLEAYDAVRRDVAPFLASTNRDESQTGIWNYLIALRNEGRLREATLFLRTGRAVGLPEPSAAPLYDGYNDAILAFERGEAHAAAGIFGRMAHRDMSNWSPGVQARNRAWHLTLEGMARAADGDMRRVRALADSVEISGLGSAYGRDRRAHHYLRGLVLAAEGRHEDAVREYRAAIHSPSLGFTRVNYELARCLLHLGRPVEAVRTLQAALRGEVDASNLYITRTEIHELLAQSFAGAGMVDSAAFHYRAVVRAWAHADPVFASRRIAAERWLTAPDAVPVVDGSR